MKPFHSAFIFMLSAAWLCLGAGGADYAEVFSHSFSTDPAGPLSEDTWETYGGDWKVAGERLQGQSGTTRAFAVLAEIADADAMEVEAEIQVQERREKGGWALSGIALRLDDANFWHLAMVEGPDGRRYAELVEKYRGTWQAQRQPGTAMKQFVNQGAWAGWNYGKTYRLTLRVSPQEVVGEIRDRNSGDLVTRIGYHWTKNRGVRRGRPACVVGGARAEFTELRVRVAGNDASGTGTSAANPWRVAVLEARPGPANTGRTKHISGLLKRAGFDVMSIGFEALESSTEFNARRYACLVLPDSPHVPSAASENLRRFLCNGGDLVLLGGLAFSDPLVHFADRWLTRTELANVLANVEPSKVLFDFEDPNSVGHWSRSSNRPEQPSKVETVRDSNRNCLHLSIRGLDGWDTFSTPVPAGLPSTATLVVFEAKQDGRTPRLSVELREEDGSRWIAVAEPSAEWRRCALPLSAFKYWRDSKSKGRGGTGDSVRPAAVRRIVFGLAFSHTGQTGGDHDLWIDTIGTAAPRLPADEADTDLQLNAFSDYGVYRLGKVREVRTAPGQNILPGGLKSTTSKPWAGWSAVAFAFPNESTFEPLMTAVDAHGRNGGHALGLLVNYRGAYRNSCWLLSGVQSPDFYRNAMFGNAWVRALKRLRQGDLPRLLRQRERTNRVAELPLTTPPPHTGFIRRSADGKHLVYPDGRRFFMIGCNYVGGFTRCGGRTWRADKVDVHQIEDDFRKAHDAGLNIMRYWLQRPFDEAVRRGDLRLVQTVRECARRYGVYLLLDLPGTGYSTASEMIASHRAIARAFRDEPMVLGYDLRNEPYVTTLGGLDYGSEKPPVQTVDLAKLYPGHVDSDRIEGWLKERPFWLHLPVWIQGDEARRVTVAWLLWNEYIRKFGLQRSSIKGFTGKLPRGEWGPMLDVVDASLDLWLRLQIEAIRREDANHLITVGHNTALCLLPANRRLDFVSKHTYIRPHGLGDVLENVTTLDRLRARWPGQPITLGEFGYSNGIAMGNGYLDNNASAVGEMTHFLYALSHDFDGCKKWMLVDWPLAVMRHYGDWNRGLATRVYEERFGLYWYDGSLEGRPKPIVPALRFLRRYVDAHGIGGKLDIVRAKTPIGAGYVFHGPGGLFLGNTRAAVTGLAFTADHAANVMMMWDDSSIRLMSTADATVRLTPGAFLKRNGNRGFRISGRTAGATTTAGTVQLVLLAGETVTIR